MQSDASAGVGTLSRVMSVLNAFTTTDRGLSAAELARRTGLPRSTAHRLAAELALAGMLDHDGTGRYRLGMRLFELGHLAVLERGLREAAAPFLADLANVTHETVHLAVREGMDVVYLDVIRPSGAPTLKSRPGGRLPLSVSGVGKAILAHSEPGLVEKVIANGLPRLTANSITDPERFRAHLAGVRTSGLAFDQQENAIGTVCCAAPVFGIGGEVIGAVSVTGRNGSLRLDRVSMAVRSTAAGITRVQGGLPASVRRET